MKTFVLCTGAYVGTWAWSPVIAEIADRGCRAVPLALPGLNDQEGRAPSSIEDAAHQMGASIRSQISEESFYLVCHNIAGIPGSLVASAMRDRVAGIIHWSSYVPKAGRTSLDDIPDEDRATLTAGAQKRGGASTLIPLDKWRDRYSHSLPSTIRNFTYPLLSPQPWIYRTATLPVDGIELDAVPAAYLVGDDDRALPTGWWASCFAERLGVGAQVFKGSHMALLSEPSQLAQALINSLP